MMSLCSVRYPGGSGAGLQSQNNAPYIFRQGQAGLTPGLVRRSKGGQQIKADAPLEGCQFIFGKQSLADKIWQIDIFNKEMIEI